MKFSHLHLPLVLLLSMMDLSPVDKPVNLYEQYFTLSLSCVCSLACHNSWSDLLDLYISATLLSDNSYPFGSP